MIAVESVTIRIIALIGGKVSTLDRKSSTTNKTLDLFFLFSPLLVRA